MGGHRRRRDAWSLHPGAAAAVWCLPHTPHPDPPAMVNWIVLRERGERWEVGERKEEMPKRLSRYLKEVESLQDKLFKSERDHVLTVVPNSYISLPHSFLHIGLEDSVT